MACTFHHVALKVKNFDAVVNFYKEVLGLKEKIAWDMDGTPAIMLEMADGGIVEVFGNGSDEPEANARWGHLAVLVDDVPAAYEKALALGAKGTISPTETAITGTSTMNVEIAFVDGLGGEVLEFFKVK
ncbi:MAG: VOC family protein [Defluviitaleaceae bacterium]|nr:VOC family protein [Defluviitaleaceae bacterium]